MNSKGAEQFNEAQHRRRVEQKLDRIIALLEVLRRPTGGAVVTSSYGAYGGSCTCTDTNMARCPVHGFG